MFATVKLSVSICQPNFFLVLSPYIMFLHYLNKYNDSSFQHIKYCFNKFAAVTFSVIQLYSTQNWKTSKEKKLHSQVYYFIQSRHVFDYDKIAVFYLPSTEDDAESKKRSLKTSKFKLYSYYTTTYGKVTMNYAARISTVTIYVCLFIVYSTETFNKGRKESESCKP